MIYDICILISGIIFNKQVNVFFPKTEKINFEYKLKNIKK